MLNLCWMSNTKIYIYIRCLQKFSAYSLNKNKHDSSKLASVVYHEFVLPETSILYIYTNKGTS